MYSLEPMKVNCPYCGELLKILIDCSESQQNYMEDCQVCCRAIIFDVHIDPDSEPVIALRREDD